MKRKTIIIVSVLMVALGTGAYYIFSGNKYKTPEWKTGKIDSGDISVVVNATGTLNPVTTVLIGAQVSGIVSKLYVDYNSTVKKGQIIALLDTTLLYAAMLDASAAMQKASVQVDLQRKEFVRMETLFKEKVVSQADYDQAYASYKAAQADLMAATATLSHEKTNLRYATIKAPIDGTVISRNVDVGQTVISSFNAPTLFSIANDLTQMQVLANVDEADIGQVKLGQEVTFTVDAYPYDIFKGKISVIRLQPVMVQNVNDYTVVIDVANPELKLLPGLTANISIKVNEHKNVLKAHINAIHFLPPAEYLKSINFPDSLTNKIQTKKIASNEIPVPNTECYIWVKNDRELSPVLVKAGIFDGTFIEVSGNIKQGEEVITGSSVTAVTTASPTANNPFMPQMRPQPKKK